MLAVPLKNSNNYLWSILRKFLRKSFIAPKVELSFASKLDYEQLRHCFVKRYTNNAKIAFLKLAFFGLHVLILRFSLVKTKVLVLQPSC